MLKKNFISIIILIILIITSVTYFLSNRNTTLSKNETAFACDDLSSVNSISIRSGDSVFILNRISNLWYYNSKFAAKPSLMSLCHKIFSQVEIKSPVAKKYSGLIRDKLRQSGTEITLINENKILKHYYIWADKQSRNIYMMMADKQIPYIVMIPSFEGNFAALFRANPEFWRDQTIIHYTPDQIASVKVEQPGNQDQSFYLEISSKGKAILTSLKSGKLQGFKKEAVEEYIFYFKSIKAEAYVENNAEIFKSTENKSPIFIITITNHEGKVNEFEIFPKESDIKNFKQSKNNIDVNSCYVLLNKKELAIVKYIEIDPITRNLDFFLQK
jgi:hypothetical protein